MILFLGYLAYAMILLGISAAVFSQALSLALNLIVLGVLVLVGLAWTRALIQRRQNRRSNTDTWHNQANW